jgi:hypothetical protein
METLQTDRTRVRRLPERGVYDRDTVQAILDAGFICHLGFVVDGQPYVIPTGYARAGDRIYIHGSTASRMARTLSQGVEVCLTVTHVDGFVLARSAFHHSVNYRSAVVLGRARLVADPVEKMQALRAFTDHVATGRFDEVRVPSEQELKGTAVLALGLEEASAKIRTGPPKDDEEDFAVHAWAGVVPVVTSLGVPIPDRDVRVAGFDTTRLVLSRTNC